MRLQVASCAVKILQFDNDAGILLHLGPHGVATIELIVPSACLVAKNCSC